ncbi:class I SAM-dependent methyltransferase [Candidatus Nomurabacteria bacterium]|nr:class I SAM-dependent methyltransferase [Candidatus Nomurabacteria bacterium]
MGKQVDSDYYFKDKYLTLERFISYFYQIRTIRKNLDKGKILFIGPGDRVVSDYLKKNPNYEIVTFDIDADLEPDVVGDVRHLPFSLDEFDLVVAFEVLEHIEYKYFEPVLSELKKISKNKVIISIPYRMTSFEFIFKFPGIRSLLHKDYLRLAFDIPLRFPGFAVSTQHYWEIDNGEFPIYRIRKSLKTSFNIQKEERPVLDRYHVFLTLTPNSSLNLNSDYVKSYYDKSMENLEDDYSEFRWNRNTESRFDYEQTKATLGKIIDGLKFKNAVEIGPGDGAWTKFFIEKSDSYNVVEQSDEMIKRLQHKFGGRNIHYVQADFLKYDPQNIYDVLFAIRCFEYFHDKKQALFKMYKMIEKNAFAVITTKNVNYVSSVSQNKLLHSGQVSMREMIDLAKGAGFSVVAIYPTTLRVKSRFAISRFIFNILFKLGLILNSRWYNMVWDWATESYTYVLQKR